MSPDDIKRFRELSSRATPGPWVAETAQEHRGADGMWWVRSGGGWRTEGSKLLLRDAAKEDLEFIAAARTALPAALDEIERLRAAWRTVNEPDEHQDPCRFGEPLGMVTPKHEAPYMQRRQCTCGLHARKAEARALLDGDVR